MIEKCKAGEIDLIVTKQINPFSRNLLDSLNSIDMLRELDPPVGVLFESESIDPLDRNRDMTITVMRVVAQSESVLKSNSIKWSYKKRFVNGLNIRPSRHSWAIRRKRIGKSLRKRPMWFVPYIDSI